MKYLTIEAKKLSTADRKKLSTKVFGLPDEKKYPMPDKAHAINAKARAKQMLDKGFLTKEQYKNIVKKADEIIKKSKK